MESEFLIKFDRDSILWMNPQGYARKSSRRGSKIRSEQPGADSLDPKGREDGDTQLGSMDIIKGPARRRRNEQSAQDASSDCAIHGNRKKSQIRALRSPVLNVRGYGRVCQNRPRSARD